MGNYTVEFNDAAGTHSIHRGLTFQEALDVIDEITFESPSLGPEVTSADGALTADELEAVESARNFRRGQR